MNEKDYGAIKIAIKGGRRSFINSACKRRNVNARNPSGVPILIWAVKEKKLMGIKTLLRRGADINIKDTDGRTPLMYAVTREGVEVVLLLCSPKYRDRIDINATDNDGWTAMNFALVNGNTDAVLILEKHGGKKGTF